jgi:hypothetical protein
MPEKRGFNRSDLFATEAFGARPKRRSLRRSSIVGVIVLLAGLASTSAASAAGPIRSFRVGLWTGGAYLDDRTGFFTDCAARIPYTNGLTIAVALNRTWGWTLSFVDPLWTLEEYRQIPVQLKIPDGGGSVEVYGTSINPTTVVVPMPGYSRMMNAFRLAYRINTSVEGQNFVFYFVNPAELMGSLLDCVRTSLALEISYPTAP